MFGKQNLIILGLTLAALAGAFGYGYHKGTVNQIEKFAEEKQKLQDQVLDLDTDLTLKAAEILRLQAANQELINELEAEALSAPGSDNPGIAATGGLQRLDRRWSTDSATTP